MSVDNVESNSRRVKRYALTLHGVEPDFSTACVLSGLVSKIDQKRILLCAMGAMCLHAVTTWLTCALHVMSLFMAVHVAMLAHSLQTLERPK